MIHYLDCEEALTLCSWLWSGIPLPRISGLRSDTCGLSVPLSVSSAAEHGSIQDDADFVNSREDAKCVIPDNRPRDEGEGPPFVCVRGKESCDEVNRYSKRI